MSWHFSRALVADYSAHISSDSLRYALSSEMSTVDLFSPSDKTTGIYHDSRFGVTYAHLKEAAGEELLTSYLADSRVRRSQLPLGGTIPQPTFGLKWQESFGKCNRPMCLPRTSPVPHAIERAAGDCSTMGYKAEMLALSAADLGADHVRERYWLLAYADDKSELRSHIDAKVAECAEFREGVWQAMPWRTGMDDGVAGRMERYEATGNGQVSIVAAAALWALAHADC